MRKTLAERWGERIQVTPEGCWGWLGAKSRGYGVLSVGSNCRGTKRAVYAHRFSWEKRFGPIPLGAFVLHKCDNPACCRPEHLFLGSHEDNMRDRSEKNRVPRGEHHHGARLTEKIVKEIRSAAETHAALATQYGVTETAIEKIINRRTWRHVK